MGLPIPIWTDIQPTDINFPAWRRRLYSDTGNWQEHWSAHWKSLPVHTRENILLVETQANAQITAGYTPYGLPETDWQFWLQVDPGIRLALYLKTLSLKPDAEDYSVFYIPVRWHQYATNHINEFWTFLQRIHDYYTESKPVATPAPAPAPAPVQTNPVQNVSTPINLPAPVTNVINTISDIAGTATKGTSAVPAATPTTAANPSSTLTGSSTTSTTPVPANSFPWWWLLLLGLGAIFASRAASITLLWDASPDSDKLDVYNVYQSNAVTGVWTRIAVLAPTQTNYTLNVDSSIPHFFYVTGSNAFWGETIPSNTANTPSQHSINNTRVMKGSPWNAGTINTN